MKKVLVINGGKKFAHSGAELNNTITSWDEEFFSTENGFEIKVTHVGNEDYNVEEEVQKMVWADLVVYHFPIWWMYMPYSLKEYFDKVLTAGHRKGLYYSDGRKSENPKKNYGTGGLMQGTKYLVTTTWNAPEEAFTIPEEFFQGRSVDDGVLFPFHRMNAFCGLEPLPSKHFHDVEKNGSAELIAAFKVEYMEYLSAIFTK